MHVRERINGWYCMLERDKEQDWEEKKIGWDWVYVIHT